MFSFEGFSQMLLNFLRVPPGASYRKAGVSSVQTNLSEIVNNNEYIQSIVDITRDDICLGKNPLYYEAAPNADESVIRVLEDSILPAYNKIIRWACRDLQTVGYSVYKEKVVGSDRKYVLVPILKNVEFFLDNKLNVVVFIEGEKVSLDKCVVFVNYEKTSLEEVDGSTEQGHENLLFRVTPLPMQLKNIDKTAAELTSTERSILKYRQQLSRILRFLNVDIGISQGDKQQEIIDQVASVVNSDPETLESMSSFTLYNDEIPVLPNRRGVGKPEYEEHIPSANISELADLDHVTKKVNMQLRFPKSYADFNEPLGETAASTIRGDVRYNRLIESIRTCLVDTVNEKLQTNDQLKSCKVVVKLSELPTPENADVIDTLQQFGGFVDDVWETIMSSEDKTQASAKAVALQTLLGGSANLKYLKKFFDVLHSAILHKFEGDGIENIDSEMGGVDEGPFEPTDEPIEGAEQTETPNDEGLEYENEVETLEPAPEL